MAVESLAPQDVARRLHKSNLTRTIFDWSFEEYPIPESSHTAMPKEVHSFGSGELVFDGQLSPSDPNGPQDIVTLMVGGDDAQRTYVILHTGVEAPWFQLHGLRTRVNATLEEQPVGPLSNPYSRRIGRLLSVEGIQRPLQKEEEQGRALGVVKGINWIGRPRSFRSTGMDLQIAGEIVIPIRWRDNGPVKEGVLIKNMPVSLAVVADGAGSYQWLPGEGSAHLLQARQRRHMRG